MFKVAAKEQLTIPANFDYLGDLRDFITLVGKKYHYSNKIVNAFKLAVDEAATNIIKHAYQDDNQTITIKAIVKRSSLTIILIDQGTFFDPSWAKDPDIKKNIDIGQKASLGIFLMRRLMDKLDYRRTEEGNELRLTKHRESRASEDSRSLATLHAPLELKHTLAAAALVTLFALAGFAYFYFSVAQRMQQEFLRSGENVANQIANQIGAVKPEILDSDEGLDYLQAIILPVFDEHIGEILSVSVEDSSGAIAWSTLPGETSRPFRRPFNALLLREGLFDYNTGDSLEVFEFARGLNSIQASSRFRHIHLLLLKEALRNKIAARRLSYGKITLIALAAAYVLLFILMHIVTNPLRKLSEWVQEVKSGALQDEMDIDATSEIGEIAQAFSEITEKFQESQKSLATQENIRKEIQLAQDIQNSLLPHAIPRPEHYEIITHYNAAQSVGGDYYDFIEVDQDAIGIAIADVSGKGVPGSMIMTMIRTVLRTEARGVRDAAEVLTRVNDFIVHDIKNGMFITVFYMILDTKHHTLNFASAGHTPMILHRGRSNKSFYLNPVGYPIGIQLPDENLFAEFIQSETIQLFPQDSLILYTDGVTEAMNPQKQLYGETRLLRTIEKEIHHELSLFAEKLKGSIERFTGGLPQNDDITFVLLRQTEPLEEAPIVVDEHLTLELKFLSVDEIDRVLSVIRQSPELGPEEISAKLDTAKYKHTKIDAERIASELQRRRLHTIQLRQEYADMNRKKTRTDRAATAAHSGKPAQPVAKAEEKAPQKRKSKSPTRKARRSGKKSRLLRITKPKLKQPPAASDENSYRNTLAPDIESDFIIGDFIDQVFHLYHPEKKTDAPGADAEDQTIHDEITKEFENQDISDSVVETLFREHLAETDTTTPGTPQQGTAAPSPADQQAPQPPSKPDESAAVAPTLPETETEKESAEHGVGEPSPAKPEGSAEESAGIEKTIAPAASAPVSEGIEYDVQQLQSELTEPEETTEPAETQNKQPSSSEGRYVDLQHLIFTDFHQWLVKGVQAYQAKQYPEAIVAFQKVLRIDSTFREGYELLGNAFFRNNQIREALAVYEMAKDKFTPSAALHENLGLIYARLGVFTLAVRELRNALKLQPQRRDIEQRVRRLQDLLDDKKTPESPAGPEPPQKLAPQFLMLREGLNHYRHGRLNEAIQVFEILTETYPGTQEIYKLLGNIYFKHRRFEDALRVYSKLNHKMQQEAGIRENVALIYARQGRYEEAISEWQRILQRHPNRTDLRKKIENLSQIV